MKQQEHPTVRRYLARADAGQVRSDAVVTMDADELHALCVACGASDAGFVEIDRPELAPQRSQLEQLLPGVQTAISLVRKMNRAAAASPTRSIANHEFHATYDEVNDVARKLVERLTARGVAAINAVAAFPMEAQLYPGKTFVIQHKPIAEAAGMGRMGIHRNVIHPRFGNFILLDTVLISAQVQKPSTPVDYNPCLECKLCVAACPVDAIGADGSFNFSACMSHNYRDFLGGFNNWVDQLVESKDRMDYRERVSEGETTAVWQSLSFKPSYKAAYCVSVCPAGDDVIGHFLPDKAAYKEQVLKPFQATKELVYVLPNSDAEARVPQRYPHKTARRVAWSMPGDIYTFLFNLTLSFQRMKSKGLDLKCNLQLGGALPVEANLSIAQQRLQLDLGLATGPVALTVRASGEDFMRCFQLDADVLGLLGSGAVALEGAGDTRAHFLALLKCFPGYGYIKPQPAAVPEG